MTGGDGQINDSTDEVEARKVANDCKKNMKSYNNNFEWEKHYCKSPDIAHLDVSQLNSLHPLQETHGSMAPSKAIDLNRVCCHAVLSL